MLRLRSDEQLVTLFRNGHDEAFRVIHDRYLPRLSAYARQMLPRSQDAEEAVQDVFLRVYTSLRVNDHEVANLRPWLYRTAHNRCIDELRRPCPPPPEVLADISPQVEDPIARVVERESLHRVVEHVKRLPAQQRSALLMRELEGAHYPDIAIALDTTVPAVKSLLVRARMTLASSLEACETPCATIREELTLAHDHGVRPGVTAKKHLRDCPGCRAFREELRGTSRQLAALAPALGPVAVLAKALGFGGAGGSAGGGAAMAGGGGAMGGGAVVSAGISTGHVATLIAACVATAGGAVEIQNSIVSSSRPRPAAQGPISTPKPQAPVMPTAATPRAAVRTPPLHVTPSAAAPSRAAVQPPTTILPPTTGSSGSSTTAPPAPNAAPKPSPVREPTITGISDVSRPGAVATSPIGDTSITGTAEVSGLKPKAQTGPGSAASTSTTSISSSASGGSDSGSSSSGDGSQSTTTQSFQSPTADAAQPPAGS